MALEPLATSDDLAVRLGVAPFSGDEKTQVDALLIDASAELRLVVGQPISRMTSTVRLRADRRGRLDLPAIPVVDIAEVKINGVGATTTLDDVWDRSLRLDTICAGDLVEVTFTHGWDPVPDELVKWVCVLAAAAKAGTDQTGSLGLTAGVGQRSIAIDDYQETVQAPQASGGDAAAGLVLPDRVAERLRASYGGGGLMYWIEVEG